MNSKINQSRRSLLKLGGAAIALVPVAAFAAKNENIRKAMKGAGFQAMRTLTFPQPCYPTGWWSATLARKGVDLSDFRERGAEMKQFATQYYNVEIHKAALAMPEFLKAALEG